MIFSTGCTADDVVTLAHILRWPQDKIFPGLDVLRLSVLDPTASALLLSDAQAADKVLSLCYAGMEGSAPPQAKFLALRTLCNLFSSPTAMGREFVTAQRDGVFMRALNALPSDNKQVQVRTTNIIIYNPDIKFINAWRDQMHVYVYSKTCLLTCTMENGT